MDKRGLFAQKLGSLFDLQRTFVCQSIPSNSLSFDEYDSLQLLLLQECDRLGYHRNTKFMAKAYFDLAVSRLQQLSSETASLYLLTAMGLAVKFNENREKSECFSIAAMIEMTEGKFQHIDFLRAEQEILTILDYQLQIVTPYDYAVLFRQVLSKYPNKKTLQNKVITLLDFAISLPYLTLLSPLYLYWACFLEVLKSRLKSDDLKQISKYISDQDEVKRIKQIVKAAIEKVFREEKLNENDFNRV